MVKTSLEEPCNGKSDCQEIRPLPEVLQGKKIVFNDDTNIMFNPYHSSSIDFHNLDVLGLIDTNNNNFYVNIIDPLSGKYGALSDREYKIIRAVYSYKCSYCFDSSDLGYIVLEDSKGNRFEDVLDDHSDSFVGPWKNVPWDEQLPESLGFWERNEIYGNLVDIK